MPDTPLIVYAAGGVAPPLVKCADLYFDKTGVRARIASGKPEDLLRDIEDMGIGDLISLGAEYFMDVLESKGLVDRDSRVSLGTRTATILVGQGNPKDIRSLEDLARDDVTVGVATAGCLLGAWEDIAAKAELTTVIRKRIMRFADSCGHLIRELNTDTVDAIIGWTSFRHFSPGKFECVPLPGDIAIKRSNALGRLTISRQPEEADRFTSFLMGAEAGEIFAAMEWYRG